MKIKTTTFKEGDKFILEIGKRKLDKYEIAGTDYFIKISLLEKLIPYKPKEKIKELKAYREREWIPCNKELPEDGERVLAMTEWEDITIAERVEPPLRDTAWFIHDGGDTATIDEIIAWMPLPEPYRGEQDD